MWPTWRGNECKKGAIQQQLRGPHRWCPHSTIMGSISFNYLLLLDGYLKLNS